MMPVGLSLVCSWHLTREKGVGFPSRKWESGEDLKEEKVFNSMCLLD